MCFHLQKGMNYVNNEKYVRCIVDFVNQKYGKMYTGIFKQFHVYNYCLDNIDDENIDEDRIKNIINITLNILIEKGYVVKFKHTYMTKKPIGNYKENNSFKQKEKKIVKK